MSFGLGINGAPKGAAQGPLQKHDAPGVGTAVRTHRRRLLGLL